MKYKSELIHEILEQRGHEKSTLHYQSECVKSWIDETKGAYPKLCDYESEWLNYINENPIGEFPYKTITTNSTATVNHVVPFEYKSAILKGDTLVNVAGEKYRDCNLPTNQYVTVYGRDNTINSDSYRIKQLDLKYPLTPNKEYLIILDVQSMENCTTLMAYAYDGTNTDYNPSLRPNKIGLNVMKYTPTTAITRITYYVSQNTEQKVIFGQPMIIEYQDGMENWDIPYFEGMKSVQMPVLTTSNEDGTKTNILTVNEDVTLRSNGNICDELNLLTGQLTQRIDEDGEVLSQEVVKTVDLTVVNQDGEPLSKIKPIEGTMHVEVSGTPINPTAVLEVPVEAITQNLNSFIEEE